MERAAEVAADPEEHRVWRQLHQQAEPDDVAKHIADAWAAGMADTLTDPRCCQPLSDVVLRSLAVGAAKAKELAKLLNVPLRTAQLALKQLVDEGACLSTREGRQVRYVLEDTTLCEPTRA